MLVGTNAHSLSTDSMYGIEDGIAGAGSSVLSLGGGAEFSAAGFSDHALKDLSHFSYKTERPR